MSPQSSNIIFNRNIIKEAIEKIVQTVSTDIPHPEIPDELFEIFVYLPELFQDGDEERYIEALSLAMQTSYENGLYQFAYMQYHMLFMTAIYFVLLKLYFANLFFVFQGRDLYVCGAYQPLPSRSAGFVRFPVKELQECRLSDCLFS